MLELKKISKIFSSDARPGNEVISDISLSICDGECVAIIGPSGSGKTTLLRIMAGLTQSSQGSIELHDKVVVGASKERGMVFQNFSLFPWLTVYDNIAFGLDLQKIQKKERDEIVNRYLIITGLSQFKHSFPSELSGGMQQRVAIARTLANSPEVMLLDEPFGALDVQTRSQMQDFLARVLEEEKRTTVIVTHDVEEALYLADKIVVLTTKPGTIKEIISVPFARPRRAEIRYEPEFVKMKKYCNYAIRSEIIKASTDVRLLRADKDAFIIGSNIWTGIAPFYLAKEKGFFVRHKLRVEIATLEWSRDRLKPWRDGYVDALNMPLDSALIEYSKDPNLRIWMPLDVSSGGDALIAHASVGSVKDLRGKRVGVEKNWVSHFFLACVLHKNGMTCKDVVLKDMKASDIGSALIAGTIEAGSIQEPWLSKAKELSKTTVLATSRDYPVIYSVLVGHRDTLEKKKNQCVKFKEIWADALAEYDRNALESIKVMAPYFGIGEVELAEQLEGLTFVKGDTNLIPALLWIQDVLLKERMLKKAVDLSQIILF